jgi:hypothetical protein
MNDPKRGGIDDRIYVKKRQEKKKEVWFSEENDISLPGPGAAARCLAWRAENGRTARQQRVWHSWLLVMRTNATLRTVARGHVHWCVSGWMGVCGLAR